MNLFSPPTPRRTLSAGGLLLLATVTLLQTGCFREKAFPFESHDFRLVTIQEPPAVTDPRSTREWLQHAHAQLAPLLPADAEPAMLTEDMVKPDGSPADVFAHFHLVPEALNLLVFNFFGLLNSAQSSGAEPAIEQKAAPWEGFEDIWIPINEHLSLSGRIGLAIDPNTGQPLHTDCIVIIPGLLGDLAVKRTREMAYAFRKYGLHVLALELRGYGQTEARYPDVYYTFGFYETGDLLAVSEWLEAKPYVRDTGLIGFCWGGNHGMLAAWEDGRPLDDPDMPARVQAHLRPRDGRVHYAAGIIAFSPTLRWEEVVQATTIKDYDLVEQPSYASLQKGIKDRMRRKQHPEISGNLQKLIHYELLRQAKGEYPTIEPDGYAYLRFMPYGEFVPPNKLEHVRVPLLIVHGANDPLSSAQDVADLMATLKNPNVAAVVLPGGGHVGFAAYSKPYFYSLMLNFFDPQRGPRAERGEPAQPAPPALSRAASSPVLSAPPSADRSTR